MSKLFKAQKRHCRLDGKQDEVDGAGASAVGSSSSDSAQAIAIAVQNTGTIRLSSPVRVCVVSFFFLNRMVEAMLTFCDESFKIQKSGRRKCFQLCQGSGFAVSSAPRIERTRKRILHIPSTGRSGDDITFSVSGMPNTHTHTYTSSAFLGYLLSEFCLLPDRSFFSCWNCACLFAFVTHIT